MQISDFSCLVIWRARYIILVMFDFVLASTSIWITIRTIQGEREMYSRRDIVNVYVILMVLMLQMKTLR